MKDYARIKITVVDSFIHPHTGDIERKTKIYLIDNVELFNHLKSKAGSYSSQTIIVEQTLIVGRKDE